MTSIRNSFITGLILFSILMLTSGVASASVFGSLGNFDVVNDTGKTAHGFEIELEDIHSSDIRDVFGGPGRPFPTGRGFDRATAVERYGAPTITEYNRPDGSFGGTRVTYKGVFDPATGTWDFGTPSGTFITPGDSCWTGGAGYGAGTPCDHFGVGTTKSPTKTNYSWLVENAATPGALDKAHVSLPTPVYRGFVRQAPAGGGGAVIVPAPDNVRPEIIRAEVEVEEPQAQEFGDAIWVKVFTTEIEQEIVELEDLIGGNPIIEQATTEIEWQLLQKEIGKPQSGMLEIENNVGAVNKTIVQRYEFYEFSGNYEIMIQILMKRYLVPVSVIPILI